MEPFEKQDLTDRELDNLLPEWKAPEAPAHLRAAVFGEPARPWWRRMWNVTVRVPLPAACAVLLLAALAVWRWAPRVVVETRTVEVPVVQEKVVYRDRPTAPTAWRPVTELQPRIIRSRNQ